MQDIWVPHPVARRQPRFRSARFIGIGDGPAARIRLDAHPLGSQREKLRRLPRRILNDLNECIAMQQQMRRHRLQQRAILHQRNRQG